MKSRTTGTVASSGRGGIESIMANPTIYQLSEPDRPFHSRQVVHSCASVTKQCQTGSGPMVMVPYVLESNRRSGVALTMRRGLQRFIKASEGL